MMTRTDLKDIAKRFPQLALPIAEGESKTEEYRAAVLRGKPVERQLYFRNPDEMALEQISTPAGTVEALFVPDRQDFLHAYRALAYRCEPADIPDSVGACIIDGLTDWGKIWNHKKEYEAAGGSDWQAEFRRFTAVKENYRTAFILLSGGPYSAVKAEAIGMNPETWLEKSIIIRKYHELCHFVCRKMRPEKKEALRDEIYADFMGLYVAFGKYDPYLAQVFMGVEGEKFRAGGRLEHYADEDIDGAAERARALIGELVEKMRAVDPDSDDGIWVILARVY